MSQRYFGAIVNNRVILSNEDTHHILKVMRMKRGDEVEVVYKGVVNICKITDIKPLELEIIKTIEENHELNNRVILLMSLLKGDKLDLVIQKACELGVDEIVLVSTSRTIPSLSNFNLEAKLNRYSKILKEAAEQSKRTKIPLLYRLIDIKDLKKIEATHKFIAYEVNEGSTRSFFDALEKVNPKDDIALFIGPEGGFNEEEVALATSLNYKVVSLGRRILRAETAAITGLSIISSSLEKK